MILSRRAQFLQALNLRPRIHLTGSILWEVFSMKATLALLVAGAGIFMTAAPVLAHHSFAATYFEDKTISIEGNLVQFLYRNPHSFVDVEVKDAKGETTRWA